MPIRTIFTVDGLNLGNGRGNLTYLYGLSDFWQSMFEDSEKIDLLLEASSIKLSDIYSKFLQLTSTISIADVEVATSQQVKLILIKDSDAVGGELNTYKLPEVITDSRFAANRLLLPTAYLEEGVHYKISNDGTEIQFFESISSCGFASRLVSVDGESVREYSIWLVDVIVDENIMYDHFGKLVGINPETSTDQFKSFIYGLYYLYSNGPNLALLRKGLNLALGIPLARETETVIDIRTNFNNQYIVITDLNSYLIPYGLVPTVQIDDALSATDQLAEWIEVKDYINDGVWWINLAIPPSVMPYIPTGQADRYAKEGSYADYVMRNFLSRHTFLVNVKTIDFKNLQSFEQLSSIINQVKPAYTYPIYIWTVPTLLDELEIEDSDFSQEWIQPKSESLTVPIEKFKRFLPRYTGYNQSYADIQASYGTPIKVAVDNVFSLVRANSVDISPSSGSYYWENTITKLPDNVLTPRFRVGLGSSSESLSAPVGTSSTSWSMGSMSSFLSSRTGEKWTTNGTATVRADKYNYVDLDGSSYMSTPNDIAETINGDIDLICKAFISPYQTDTATLISKWDSTTNNRAYALQVRPDGIVRLLTSPDGVTIHVHESTASVTFGQAIYIRSSLDVDDGAGNRVANFYLSGNGVNWTQLGATVTKAGVTSLYSSTASVLLGVSGFSPTFEVDFAGTGSIVPATSQVPTFTRATTATVVDHDSVVRTVLSSETRFQGMRRIRNNAVGSENIAATGTDTHGGVGTLSTCTAGFTAPDGTSTAFRIQANIGVGTLNADFSAWQVTATVRVGSCWMKSNNGSTQTVLTAFTGSGNFVTIDTTWRRYTWTNPGPATAMVFGTLGNLPTSKTIDILIWHPQAENEFAQATPIPGEYLSTGVLSSPYHGANVDGVKYFPRYNGNVVQQNLLIKSQEFDDAAWSKVGTTISANAAIAPDSTLTADKVVAGLGLSGAAARVTSASAAVTSLQWYTFSVYAKAAEQTVMSLGHGGAWAEDGGGNITLDVNLLTGVVTTNLSGGSTGFGSATLVGNGWYRIQLTCKGTGTPAIQIMSNIIGDGVSGFYVWGGQQQPGRHASTYVLTTTVAINNGIVEEATDATIPTSTRLGYYSEGQRTNLCLQSEDFSNASWTKNASTVGGSVVLPNGATGTVNKIQASDSVTNTVHSVTTTAIVSASTQYSISIWAKAAEETVMVMANDNTGTATFNLGTVTTTRDTGSSTIVSYPNGWYLCTWIVTLSGTAVTSIRFNMRANGAYTAAATGNGLYLWGAQVEQALFASTYIATTTASVTRNADNLSYSTSGWFTSVPNTLSVSFTPTQVATSGPVASLQKTGNDAFWVGHNGTGLNGVVVTGGVLQSELGGGSLASVGTNAKIAATFQLNDMAVSANGVTPGTFGTIAVPASPTILQIGFGGSWSPFFGPVAYTKYYPRRITNSGLQNLSSGTALSGSDATGISSRLTGKLYNSDIRFGIGGLTTIKFDSQNGIPFDTTPIPSSSGNTWTFNASAAMRTELTPYYLNVLGTTGDSLTTPDSVATSITGDMSVRVKLALADYAPSSVKHIISKQTAGSTQLSWKLELVGADFPPSGRLNLQISTTGLLAGAINHFSTIALPAINGNMIWVRTDVDVDNGASGHDVWFYYSPDGLNWTQLGAKVTTVGTISIFDSTTPVAIGSNDSTDAQPISGQVFYAEIRKGVDLGSPVIASFDANDARTLTGGNVITNNVKTNYGSSVKLSDVIGVLYNSDTGSLNYYINGVDQGLAFSGLTGTLYPMLSIYEPNTIIETNFGDKDFLFSVPVGAKVGVYVEETGLTRDVPYFTRGTVSYFESGQVGQSSQVNGVTRDFEGAILTGYINGVSQLRPTTRDEKAWVKTTFTRDSEANRPQRSVMAFARNILFTDDTGVGVRQFQQPDINKKVVYLYTTTQKDLEDKFSNVGAQLPGLDKWSFTMFTNDASGNPGINTRGVNDTGTGTLSYFGALKSSYDSFFSRGPTYTYLGTFAPAISYDSYKPDISELKDGDYLLFIRIYENTVGVYWVTSNTSLPIPCYRVASSNDPISLESDTATLKRGLSYYSSFYLIRGTSGQINSTIGAGINNIPINDAASVPATSIIVLYADEKNPTPVTIDRSGVVLKFRRDFK